MKTWWTNFQISMWWCAILLHGKVATTIYAQLFRLRPEPIRWEDGYDI